MASGAVHLMGNLAPGDNTHTHRVKHTRIQSPLILVYTSIGYLKNMTQIIKVIYLKNPFSHTLKSLHIRRSIFVLVFNFNFPITVFSESPGFESVINQVSSHAEIHTFFYFLFLCTVMCTRL